MATLYRKYRPQNWEEVVGQNHIKVTLEQEIANSRVSHAYLFTGPRAVGKTTVARVLAKSLNCLKRKDKEYEPCNQCDICRDITRGRELDIIEIDAASHTGVDNIRENIIAAARVAPSRCRYKVFIIDEVHMLSISAFNALLKVLEEPPEFVVFVLCTTEVHKIPATIISRCERFDFSRINVKDIVSKLNYITQKEKIKVGKDILENIARMSGGHMRDAESILGQIVAIGGKEITAEEADLVIPRSDLNEAVKVAQALARKDPAQGISLVNKLVSDGVDLKRFSGDFVELLRKLLLIKINPSLSDRLGLEMGESLELRITEVAKTVEAGQVLDWLDKFVKAREEIKKSFITQLPLEMAVVRSCQAAAASQPANPPPSRTGQAKTPAAPEASSKDSRVTDLGTIDSQTINAKWNEVLARVKQHNHSLSFILRVCEPKDLSGDRLCLAFKYKFHKDRVGDKSIKDIIEKILKEVYGRPLSIEAVIDENIQVKAEEHPPAADDDKPAAEDEGRKGGQDEQDPKTDDTMNNLLKTFGGKVVK